MKKHTVKAAILAIMISVFASAAFAEETEQTVEVGKDVYLTVGYKMWFHTWQTAVSTYPPYDGANLITLTSKPMIAHIPSASVKVKDFFVSGSYMFTSEYEFPDYEDASNDSYYYMYTLTGKRKELDINVGYYVVPSLAVTAGYKQVKQTYIDEYSESTTTYTGPTIGVTGSGALGAGFALYGNFSYGFMKAQYEGASNEDDAAYSSTEIGIAYRPWSPFSLSAGYKYQTIDTKLSDADFTGQTAFDVTKGLIFGANLVF